MASLESEDKQRSIMKLLRKHGPGLVTGFKVDVDFQCPGKLSCDGKVGRLGDSRKHAMFW